MNACKRGDIWWVDLGTDERDISGHLQVGLRPCLIVSNDINNEHSPTLNVIPLSCKIKPLPVHPRIYLHNRWSIFLCEQIRTIPKSQVGEYYGYANSIVMERVERCLKLQLGL